MCAADEKSFLWRFWKKIFPARYRHWKTSSKTAFKTQEKHVVQIALLRVRSPWEVASMFRFKELETGFFKKLRLDTAERIRL